VTVVEDPEVWRWIWLAAAVTFGLAEVATAGSFFMLPFAIGAVLATLLAFLGVALLWQWLVFLVVSAVLVGALRPLAKRLAHNHPAEGIGAKRLIGQQGTILAEIPEGTTDLGLVRIEREEWRAESLDGTAVATGTPVRIVEQRGTRVVVAPIGPPPVGPAAVPPLNPPETE
jgi:membrane protein implicated in regulation of membrane protease activity